MVFHRDPRVYKYKKQRFREVPVTLDHRERRLSDPSPRTTAEETEESKEDPIKEIRLESSRQFAAGDRLEAVNGQF